MELSIPNEIKLCLAMLRQHGFPAYIVGGCVRDSLLGRAPSDWDICSAALPDEVAACFPDYKTIPTGIKHGTVTVLIDAMPVEVTTFRQDGDYLDHRRPRSVDFTSSLSEDLARRDFSVNAMAYYPGEGLVDPFRGYKDLKRGILRCVGDAEARFTEDALRILRLFRFSAQLDFTVDDDALRGASACRRYLDCISGERILAELSRLLVCPRPGNTLQQMCGHGVLQAILPEFAPCVGFAQHTPYHNRTVDEHTFAAIDASPPLLEVRLALLLHDTGKPATYRRDQSGRGHFKGHAAASAEIARCVLRRLKADNRTTNRVVTLIALHDEDIFPQEPFLRRLAAKIGLDMLELLLEVRIADNLAKRPEKAQGRLAGLVASREALSHLKKEPLFLHVSDLAVNGSDLLTLGYPTGRPMGQALELLLDEVLEEPARNNRPYLLQKAAQLLQESIDR